MGKANLKLRKVKQKNPKTGVVGFRTVAIINGTESMADIAQEAAHNTTVHPKEVETALALAMEAAAKALKNGLVVDLGPLGKIYPSVSGKWTATAEEQSKSDLQKKVTYAPSDDVKAAIAGASLSWEKAEDGEGGEPADEEPEVELPDLEP